jgi:ABC-2 type transport system permease protein
VGADVSALLRVARHETRTVLADRGALMILVLGALGYAFFYPIPYLNEVVRSVPVAVVDPDGSTLSRRLTRMLDATEAVDVDAVVATPTEGERRVRTGEAHGVLSIPAEFEADVLRGEPVVVGVFGDASYFLLYSQVASAAARSVGTLSAGVEVRRMEAAGIHRAAALRRWRPLPLALRPLYNPAGGYGTYVVPAVLVLVLQQTLLIGIGLLAGSARERGVDEGRLLRANPVELLTGKALVYVGLYLVHALVYLAVVFRVFGFPRQAHPLAAILFLVPFLLAVTFLGLAVSAWFRERETAIQVLLFTSLPAVFISGSSWPPEAMPGWLRALAQLLPSTPGITGFLRLNQMGAGFHQVRGAWLTLWALAAAYFGLALLSRRRIPVRST